MISKVSGSSSTSSSSEPLLRIPTSTDQAQHQTTLTSLSIRPLYSWIPALFNQIWWMIKSLFCCFRYPSHHNTEFKPEINPRILSTSDPFYKTLFNSDQSLKNIKAYQLSCEVFDILGEGGTFHWGYHLRTLNEKKTEILSCDIHPLESLYFLFHNKPMTKLVCHFLDNATFGIGARFLREYATKFKQYSKLIKPQIPGFCRLLNLDEPHIRNLVNEQKWQELIQYVHKTREKHFNI